MFESLMDFFIKLFGGVYRGQTYYATIGPNLENNTIIYTKDIPVNILGKTMSLGNYLSFMASLISLIIIVVLCCLFIAKLVKGVAHLINR